MLPSIGLCVQVSSLRQVIDQYFTINQIKCQLLKFCLDTTYFVYKNQIYKQKRGAARGSPVSPVIANLYMEVFEERALSTTPHPPPHPCGSGTWMTRSLRFMNTTLRSSQDTSTVLIQTLFSLLNQKATGSCPSRIPVCT